MTRCIESDEWKVIKDLLRVNYATSSTDIDARILAFLSHKATERRRYAHSPHQFAGAMNKMNHIRTLQPILKEHIHTYLLLMFAKAGDRKVLLDCIREFMEERGYQYH